MNRIKVMVMPVVALIWATAYFIQVSRMSAEDQLLIRPVYFALLALFIYNTIKDLRNPEEAENQTTTLNRKVVIIAAMCAAFIALLPFLGFLLDSIAFILGALILFKVKDLKVLVGVPVIVSGVLYFLFTEAFFVPLPKGLLAWLL
jgi:hypothetical protein